MAARSTVRQRLFGTTAPGPAWFVRVIVGWIFLSEGIQKFLFPDALGVGRFIKIGIPMATFTAPFVGIVEIVGGALLIMGLATRLAAIALFIAITVAIISTKIPMLVHKGFRAATHEARRSGPGSKQDSCGEPGSASSARGSHGTSRRWSA
jgi:uncharacterized membrane protein YphA (DoxX/SURF4 family)